DRLSYFFHSRNMLSPRQYGFTPQKSTIHAVSDLLSHPASDTGTSRLTLTMLPWLWALSLRTACGSSPVGFFTR
ncbi:hypothetical protein RUM43_009246, partial [Polyplax serrata]